MNLKGKGRWAMSDRSKIEWTDASWNPVRGCTPVSPGCDHCYARRFAERFRGTPGHPYERGFDVRAFPEALDLPLQWRKPRRVFVCSMSDLFHPDISREYINFVIINMQIASQHTYQVLTKRAERMGILLSLRFRWMGNHKHIWWGVTAEDRKHGLPRIRHLQRTRAAVRFVSFEPLLEDVGRIPLRGIHWVIVGGESGPGARPMRPEWVRSIRAQCRKAKIPFFFKQWGGVQKGKAGRVLDGRTYDEFPGRGEGIKATTKHRGAEAPRRRGTEAPRHRGNKATMPDA
jgi:protein gp37